MHYFYSHKYNTNSAEDSSDMNWMVHGKKGTEKRAQKKWAQEKNVFICRLLLLLFNQQVKN